MKNFKSKARKTKRLSRNLYGQSNSYRQFMQTSPKAKVNSTLIMMIIFGSMLIASVVMILLPYIQNLSANNPTDHSRLQQTIVHRIIDGDTIDVIILNESGEQTIERIRFIGIDAPEMGRFGSETGAEAGAIEARDFVAGTIPIGSTIWLEQQGNDRDRFGRLRRVVWFEVDGQLVNLNQLLLDEGLAVEIILN